MKEDDWLTDVSRETGGDEVSSENVAPRNIVSPEIWNRLAELPSAIDDRDEPPTPIAVEAERATRVLHARDLSPFNLPERPRVIAVSNQKGGVGKTTSAVNLAVALSIHGARVLVIDSDPQGNASTGLGVEHAVGTPSIYDVLIGDSSLADVVVGHDSVPGLTCAPATIDLAGAEIELVSVVARETRLRKAIAGYLEERPEAAPHYVLIDCPPSLGLLTVNALVAADEVLIPIQCEYYALEGLGQLLSSIEMIRAHLNEGLAISTILLTMYDARTRLSEQVADEVRRHFGPLVLESVVPRSVRVSEAPGYGQSVLTYDPGSRGAISYLEAAREMAERGRAAPHPPAPELPSQDETSGPASGSVADSEGSAADAETSEAESSDSSSSEPGIPDPLSADAETSDSSSVGTAEPDSSSQPAAGPGPPPADAPAAGSPRERGGDQ
ncbi:MAG: AAA family ATPase, partial [Geodermatophilaceae bacterium]|nr:AAA family ATPase [Geodermatophilaceae bacterium]